MALSPSSSRGGGFSPVQANYSGDPVTIPDGTALPVPFTTLDTGTELLDRTTPEACSILTAGTYTLTIKVYGDALTAGGFCLVRPFLGHSFNATSLHPDYGVSVTVVGVVSAGANVAISVANHDGAFSRAFYIDNAQLVRLA